MTEIGMVRQLEEKHVSVGSPRPPAPISRAGPDVSKVFVTLTPKRFDLERQNLVR